MNESIKCSCGKELDLEINVSLNILGPELVPKIVKAPEPYKTRTMLPEPKALKGLSVTNEPHKVRNLLPPNPPPPKRFKTDSMLKTTNNKDNDLNQEELLFCAVIAFFALICFFGSLL